MMINSRFSFKKLTLAYFGSPDFSARLLEKIVQDKNLPVDLTLVVTQSDKSVGRKQILTATPVKTTAQKYGIEVLDDKSEIRNPKSETNYKFKTLKSKLSLIDIALVYAYGGIIPAELLRLPCCGFFNLHPSLLPYYRGPSPIAYPLFLGETKTGVTFIQMDQKIDHGDIILQEETPISAHEKRNDLETRLTDLAFNMFKSKLLPFFTNHARIEFIQQENEKATYTRLLTKTDGFIDLTTLRKALNRSPITTNELPTIIKNYLYQYPDETAPFMRITFNFSILIFNLFRAFSPWPGIWTKVIIKGKEKRLKITDMVVENDQLLIKKVQLEGKKEADFEQLQKAYGIFKI